MLPKTLAAMTSAVWLTLVVASAQAQMPSAAPSFNNRAKNAASVVGETDVVGRSTMTVRTKNPDLQSDTAGSVKSGTSFLEGGVMRVTGATSNDAFAAAGIALTEPITRKPKSARVDQDTYRAWLNKTHPQFSLKVASVNPIEVLEIKGQWDKSDRTLNNLGIPHTTIGAGQLSGIGLDRTKVIVINCAGKLPRNSLQGLRDFVARGGYLLTTDWALDNMLTQTFPGFVVWNGGKSKGNVVDAAVAFPEKEIMRGTVSNASWKLDDESHTVRILKTDAVKVLAVSRDLVGLDPDRQGILAVVFSFGRGKVLHLVGHFENNALPLFPRNLPDPAPLIGIGLRQAMAANFVVAGVERDR
ncbi:MAG: hypothetical protein IAF58_10135 [Leptolyngbya sp.]|nr:hypothetical protein [Candidatus Melainabacteria bacterium]